MSESITYTYNRPSQLQQQAGEDKLLLSQYSGAIQAESDCFFWGKLTQPYVTARCLISLSQVVQSSFNLSPFQLALLRDPIVTAGNERLRLEGFSHCAGVYARVDILPDGHDGEFLANGTTNVDFNPPMIASLGQVKPGESMILSVGEKEVGLIRGNNQVIERKVPLPRKWIKGLTSVQVLLADSERVHQFNRIQAIQLLRSIPRSKSTQDHYLLVRGGRVQFSPVKQSNGLVIGGVHRLRLLEPLLAWTDQLQVFAREDGQSTTWQLRMGPIRFTLSLSREAKRGFSGEGAGLEALVETLPESWITSMNHYSYANQTFNPTLFGIEENLSPERVKQLTTALSAMGLLGFDVEDNAFFYRRLPFDLSRILSLNPRLKHARELIASGGVQLIHQTDERVEAQVLGSGGVFHTVMLDKTTSRCTCKWFNRHQGERGPCKHVLAVRHLSGQDLTDQA